MSVRCDFKFEDVDVLLKRNWFMDTEDLYDLLYELPEDVYSEVVERRNDYHPNVRWALGEPAIPTHFIRKPVRGVSDSEWQTMEETEERESRNLTEEMKKLFSPPPRPQTHIDIMAYNARADIDKHKDILDKLVDSSRKTQRYLGTSRRGQLEDDNPEIRAARIRLASAENEFARVKELLDSSNKSWNDLMWCDAMLQDAARRRLSPTAVPATRRSA